MTLSHLGNFLPPMSSCGPLVASTTWDHRYKIISPHVGRSTNRWCESCCIRRKNFPIDRICFVKALIVREDWFGRPWPNDITIVLRSSVRDLICTAVFRNKSSSCRRTASSHIELLHVEKETSKPKTGMIDVLPGIACPFCSKSRPPF